MSAIPSASWLNNWVAGDIVTAAEFKKGMGCVYDQILSSPAASIDTLAVLPTTYAHLRIEFQGRGDTAAANTNLQLRFNNDSAANYDFELGSHVAATTSAAETFAATSIIAGSIAANTAGASLAGHSILDIVNYGGTTFNKTVAILASLKTGTATGNMTAYRMEGHWRSTAAINRVTVFPAAGNFVAGSRLTVYVMGF